MRTFSLVEKVKMQLIHQLDLQKADITVVEIHHRIKTSMMMQAAAVVVPLISELEILT